EVGIDLHCCDDRAQISGHRLMQGQQAETAVIDLNVKLIDRLVAGQNFVDDGGIALDESVQGKAHPFLGKAAHFEQPALKCFELFAEVGDLAIH
ncbi:MAG TPA: hypothetical protein VMS40_06150, partial [Vicinamibacterales bacterium]|nr:hypothetical protein [Vicinamibacterales bacterium]